MPGTPGLPKPVAVTGEASAMSNPPGLAPRPLNAEYYAQRASEGFAARIRVNGASATRCLSWYGPTLSGENNDG